MSDWVIGVDLGRTKIAMGLVDPQNRIVERRRFPTRAEEGAQAVIDRLARNFAELEAVLPRGARVRALGICAPGPVDHETGTILEPHQLEGLHNTPLARMLSDRLGLPVALEHDAKAAALGEFHYGAGSGERSMVYVVVGTGVGAAIVVDGQILRGLHNLAGEVGHITLDREGELCPCGSRGCVETYMSGPWLARRYARTQAQPAEKAGSLAPVTGELVTALAEQGDPVARRIFVQAGEALGVAIASMAMILDIDLYVVGGSVVKAGDLFLEPARLTVPHYSYRSVSARVRIVGSQMGEDAPILGSSWLAREAALKS